MNIKWPLRIKNKTNFFVRMKTFGLIFLGTKIKIRYIYKDEKLI